MEGLASAWEVKTKWDLVDILEAHELLDLKARAQKHIMKNAKAGS